MLNVLSKGLKVKQFCNYDDGTVEEKLNKFFLENSNLSIIKIDYTQCIPSPGYDYPTECAMVYYKEFKS